MSYTHLPSGFFPCFITFSWPCNATHLLFQSLGSTRWQQGHWWERLTTKTTHKLGVKVLWEDMLVSKHFSSLYFIPPARPPATDVASMPHSHSGLHCLFSLRDTTPTRWTRFLWVKEIVVADSAIPHIFNQGEMMLCWASTMGLTQQRLALFNDQSLWGKSRAAHAVCLTLIFPYSFYTYPRLSRRPYFWQPRHIDSSSLVSPSWDPSISVWWWSWIQDRPDVKPNELLMRMIPFHCNFFLCDSTKIQRDVGME